MQHCYWTSWIGFVKSPQWLPCNDNNIWPILLLFSFSSSSERDSKIFHLITILQFCSIESKIVEFGLIIRASTRFCSVSRFIWNSCSLEKFIFGPFLCVWQFSLLISATFPQIRLSIWLNIIQIESIFALTIPDGYQCKGLMLICFKLVFMNLSNYFSSYLSSPIFVITIGFDFVGTYSSRDIKAEFETKKLGALLQLFHPTYWESSKSEMG